ncbi:MAG: helix-turn-helix domain-containing protein [bacterium]
MTDQAQLIDAVIQAPPSRREAILQAALGKDQPRPGKIAEAAAILHTCKKTIERYGKAGLLTPIRISPRCIRYDLSEVERLATRGVEPDRTRTKASGDLP